MDIFCHSSENMHELKDNRIGLVITSPPYNVGMEYEPELMSVDEYRAFHCHMGQRTCSTFHYNCMGFMDFRL